MHAMTVYIKGLLFLLENIDYKIYSRNKIKKDKGQKKFARKFGLQ